MFDALFTTDSLIALLTLTSMEIVLGIDNIIFIAILAGKLPADQRDKARKLGLSLAVISRLLLVCFIGFIIQLKTPWFTFMNQEFSGKDIILLIGGLFLIGKATYEIHHKVVHNEGQRERDPSVSHISMRTVLVQVIIIDVVFSLDSVLTAVGMTKDNPSSIPIMVAAILISIAVMLYFSKWIVDFIDRNPAIKILALAFLILIGTLLVAEGCHQHFDKSYIYFAMAFSVLVECLQMVYERKQEAKLPAAPQA